METQKKTPSSDSETSPRTILIVDDEADLRNTLSDILSRKEGFDVHLASNGDEALKVASKLKNLDAVITDFKMPQKNGLEFLEALQTEGYQVPVVMVSAFADVGFFRQAMRLGAVDFLAKPFSTKDIRAAIHRAAEIGAMTRALVEAVEAHASPELLSRFHELRIFRHFLNRLPLTG